MKRLKRFWIRLRGMIPCPCHTKSAYIVEMGAGWMVHCEVTDDYIGNFVPGFGFIPAIKEN